MYNVDESDESEIKGYSRSAGLASRLLLELLQFPDAWDDDVIECDTLGLVPPEVCESCNRTLREQ